MLENLLLIWERQFLDPPRAAKPLATPLEQGQCFTISLFVLTLPISTFLSKICYGQIVLFLHFYLNMTATAFELPCNYIIIILVTRFKWLIWGSEVTFRGSCYITKKIIIKKSRRGTGSLCNLV